MNLAEIRKKARREKAALADLADATPVPVPVESTETPEDNPPDETSHPVEPPPLTMPLSG